MHRDVVGLVALDFILWIILARVMGMPLVIGVFGVHLDDLAADMAGLRVPGHVIADFESFVIMNLRSRFELAATVTPRF